MPTPSNTVTTKPSRLYRILSWTAFILSLVAVFRDVATRLAVNSLTGQTIHQFDVANRPAGKAPKMGVEYDNWFSTMIHSISNPFNGWHIEVFNLKTLVAIAFIVIVGLVIVVINMWKKLNKVTTNSSNTP